MIKSIKIQNYKLFKSLSLEEIPRILLIGGKNNCGKTSVLEAINLTQDFANPGMFIDLLSYRAPHISDDVFIADNLWFASSYHKLKLDKPITFEYKIDSSRKKVIFQPSSNIETSVTINKSKQTKIDKKSNSILEGIKISYWRDVNKKENAAESPLYFKNEKFVLENRKSLLSKDNSFFLPSNFSTIPEDDADRYTHLELANNTQEVVKALQILEPDLKSLSILSRKGNPVIYGDISLKQKIPLFLMGQGMNRLLSLLLIISEQKNGIVLVDEFENGFHHSILAKIWEAIAGFSKANNTQIIATTHSRELISGAVEGIPSSMKSEFKYMRIEKENNKFVPKNYDFETLRTALDSGLEIR